MRERGGRYGKVNGIAYTHPCDCQLGLLVSVLGNVAANRFVSLLYPASNLHSYNPCISRYLSSHPHTHSTLTLARVCIECTFAVGQGHPQGQNAAQSEHFSHSLLYSLAFTCEHDNKTPFVRRQ